MGPGVGVDGLRVGMDWRTAAGLRVEELYELWMVDNGGVNFHILQSPSTIAMKIMNNITHLTRVCFERLGRLAVAGGGVASGRVMVCLERVAGRVVV